MEIAEQMATGGHAEAAAVLACWRWCATLDTTLEADLRAGANHYPLWSSGRPRRPVAGDRLALLEARAVLERGAAGRGQAWLLLGNFYADEMRDEEAAEEAYRGGIAAA